MGFPQHYNNYSVDVTAPRVIYNTYTCNPRYLSVYSVHICWAVIQLKIDQRVHYEPTWESSQSGPCKGGGGGRMVHYSHDFKNVEQSSQ